MLKHQSHFAEKCNFALPAIVKDFLLLFFFNIKRARAFRHNNNDFASPSIFVGKKKKGTITKLLFIVHVRGKRVKEEENICQITTLMTASVRVECEMCTEFQAGWGWKSPGPCPAEAAPPQEGSETSPEQEPPLPLQAASSKALSCPK